MAAEKVLGSEGGGIVNRINGAMDFAQKLLDTNPAFSRANPLVGDRLTKMQAHSRDYLAHEYFNRDWHPMHFATMAEWLEGAKVQFACSANYLDHIDVINLSTDQQAFLKDIPDAMFRETTRDFMVNQQFRKDYWVKGARTMTPLDQAEALRSQRVILTTPRADAGLKVTGSLGEATLHENVYVPILDALADHKVKSLAQLEAEIAGQSISFAQLRQAIIMLVGIGYVMPVQEDAVANKARKVSAALNAHLLQCARSMTELSYLASPVVGGAVQCVCGFLHVVRIHDQRFGQFTCGAGKAAEDQHALQVVTGGHEFLAHQVHAVVQAGHVAVAVGHVEADRGALRELAAVMPADPDLIERYRAVARRLSDHERGQAERALDRFAVAGVE